MPMAPRTHRTTERKRDSYRPSSSKRGYDRRWYRFQRWYLAKNPFCRDCEEAGKVTPATEVHHIEKVADRPELMRVDSNCMALCKPCHSKRTARGE